MNHLCKLCGYEWNGRLKRKPKQCPNCKRMDWDGKKMNIPLIKKIDPWAELELIRNRIDSLLTENRKP